MLNKFNIRNKIAIIFTVIYSVYFIIISIFTYNNNFKILKESMEHRIIESYYQLSTSIAEDIRIDNTYQINQKINNLVSKNEEIAYIIVYDYEKEIIGKNLSGIPEKLKHIEDNRNNFVDFNSSKGMILDYVSKIEDLDIGYIRIGFYTKSIYDKTYREFLRVVLLNAIVFFMLSIIFYYISKSIEEPIKDLTKVTKGITENSNYDNILKREKYGKDFYVLVDSINEMILKNNKNKKLNNRLLNKIFIVQEDERKSLSRELHDEVSQSLVSLLFLLTNLIDKETDDKKRNKLILIKDELDNSLFNIRNIAVNLRPPILEEHGIIEAIEKYVLEYASMYNIEVEFKTNIDFIDNDIFNISVYRIIQECLNNIKRHSQANKAEINFYINSDYIVLSISDNGIGLSDERIENSRQEGRLGVYGIRERVMDFEGKFSIYSSEEFSTIINCTFKKNNILKEI